MAVRVGMKISSSHPGGCGVGGVGPEVPGSPRRDGMRLREVV